MGKCLWIAPLANENVTYKEQNCEDRLCVLLVLPKLSLNTRCAMQKL